MLELAVATSPHRNPEHACRTKSAGLPSDIPFTTLFPAKEVEEEEEKSEDEEKEGAGGAELLEDKLRNFVRVLFLPQRPIVGCAVDRRC